jgi:hypothetical protein
LKDRVFITRNEPEAALVLWKVRTNLTTRLIEDDPHYVCDHCNRRLDWEPFPVIVLPTREELRDPDYVPVGGDAFCRACARKCYHLTKKDVYRARWLWFCYG